MHIFLCLVIVNVNMTEYVQLKMSDLSLSDVFFQALNVTKLVFFQGSAQKTTGELTTLPHVP